MAEKQFKPLKKKGLSKTVKSLIIFAIVSIFVSVGGFTAYSIVMNKQNEQVGIVVQQAYTITYNLDGGENSSYNNLTYKAGDEITLQPAKKPGYTFLGWYTDENFENQIRKITRNDRQDFTLYAKWEFATYNITYDLDEGYNNLENPQIFHYDEDDIVLQDASKYGYTFLGWYTDADFVCKISVLETSIASNVTLYAKFEITNYSAIYKADGVVVDAFTFNVENMSTKPVPEIPAKAGYTAEWGDNISLKNIVIEAVYTPIVYNITYNLNDGTNNATNLTMYTVEYEDITLSSPTREGYDFAGWYTDSELTNRIYTINTETMQNYTLYAKWDLVTYYATFIANGEVVESVPFTILDMSVTAPEVPTKVGYTGVWPEFNVVLQDFAVMAQYNILTFNIMYELYGGINNSSNPTSYNVTYENIVLAGASKDYYNFDGWYLDAEFTLPIETIDVSDPAHYSLYAKYSPINYTATFKAEGNIVDTVVFNVENIDDFVEPNVPEKLGFTGVWARYHVVLDNFTVNAEYSIITYTITYHVGAGTNSTSNPSTFTVNDEDIVLEDASLAEYDFVGWYTDSALENQISIIDTSSVQDYVLYAKFNTIDYIATFIAEGVVVARVVVNVVNINDFAEPSVPEKFGYTGAWENYTVVLGAFTVNAVYTINTYTITYKLVDGINDPNNPSGYTIDDENITLLPATKDGFTFKGWYLENNYKTQISVINTQSVQNYKIYAKWGEKEYIATFMKDNAVYATKTFKASNPTISNPSFPNKNGYTGAWEEYTIDPEDLHDFTVNAIYTPISYVIYYKMYNGTNNPNNPTSYTIEDANITLLDPTKVGYDFMGWYTEPEFINPITIVDTSKLKRYNIYAKWEEKYLTIRYLNGDEVLYTEPTQVEYGSTYTVKELNLTVNNGESIISYKLGNTEYYVSAEVTANKEPMDFVVYKRSADSTDYTYTISNGYATITSYTGSDTSLHLPNYVINPDNGKWCSVANIANNAFTDNTSITSVYIPTNIKNLNTGSFNLNGSFSSNGASSGGSGVFSCCTNLTSVTFAPDSELLKFGAASFYSCVNLTSIDVPAKLQQIADGAFYNCTNLRDITFTNDSVCTSLGKGCFAYCYSLENIQLPDSLSSIQQCAFFKCSSLASIIIPNGVNNIWRDTFDGCTSLSSVTFSNSLEFIGAYAFMDCISLKSITIPNTVKKLDNAAFIYCYKLNEVIFEENSMLEEFGYGVFANCLSLTTFTMPDSDFSMDRDVFIGCFNLISIVWPENTIVTKLNLEAFRYSGLLSLTIPSSVTNFIFYYDTSNNFWYYRIIEIINYTDIDIWQELEDATANSLYGYTHSIQSYVNKQEAPTYTSKIQHINDVYYYINGADYIAYAYIGESDSLVLNANCTEIASFYSEVDSYGISFDAYSLFFDFGEAHDPDIAFSWDGLDFYSLFSIKNITIPSSLTSIKEYAFYESRALERVYYNGTIADWSSINFSNSFSNPMSRVSNFYILDSNGETLYNGTNYSLLSLGNISISITGTTIGQYAFYNFSNITSITISDSVTSIGFSAFYNCNSLTSMTMPFACGDSSSTAYFGYIFGSIDYSESNQYVPTSLQTVTITSGIIGSNAFYSCSSLREINLPSGITSIGPRAFTLCSSLANLIIPQSVTSIGNNAFYGCKSLTSLTIPNNVTIIGSYAFYGCSKLTSITIPSSVTSIGTYAFSGCSNLASVTFATTIGWKRGSTSISSSYLSNTSTAATYLRSTYASYTWTRS